MSRNACTRTILLSTLLLIPALAGADALDGPQGPHVLILLKHTEPVVIPGQSYNNTLRVSLGEAGALEAFAFSDNGWTTVSLEQPPGGTLPAGTEFDLDFEVIPVDPSMPLQLSTRFEGSDLSCSYDLSLQGWERMNTARGLLSIGDSEPALVGDPARDDGPVGSLQEADEIAGSAASRTITIHGRLVYERRRSPSDSTPVLVGAYGFTVNVWDDDTLGRDPMGETVTDAGGYYSVTTTWTASEDPDIYVEVRAENAHMLIRPGAVLTRVYEWRTETSRNYGGENINFGTRTPEDEDDWPVLHIMTTLRRARAWMSARSVAPSEGIVVYYPEGHPHYGRYFGVGHIFLGEGARWKEATQVHEYGHHWMHDKGLDIYPTSFHFCILYSANCSVRTIWSYFICIKNQNKRDWN